MKTEMVLQGLLKHARSEILKEFRADSCIASTAVGIDVLSHFNIVAEPLAVRTLIFNEQFANRLSNLKSWPTKQQVEAWSEEDGSYSVGIGVGTQQANKWAGHLVVLVEKQFVLDLSIDQASRPQYNIVLNPFLVEINKDFFTGSPKVFNFNQCVIRIETLNNKDYLLTPDWEFKNRRSNIVTSLIEVISNNEKSS